MNFKFRSFFSQTQIKAFIKFLSPAQKYMAFLSLMLGGHAWVQFFLKLNSKSLLALLMVHGFVLLFWIFLIRSWQPYHPEVLTYLNPQTHAYWYSLKEEKRKELTPVIKEASRLIKEYPRVETVEPFQGVRVCVEDLDLRRHPLAFSSKVAVFTFAGGQATRLGTNKPKACLELTDLNGETFSLLEYHSRYFKGFEGQKTCPFWAILTSEGNHEVILSLLEENNYFGLDPRRVDCIKQEDLPLLDAKGRLWLHQEGYLLYGPDGNGSAFKALLKAQVIEKWQKAGVEYVTLNLIDNPLAYPFEFSLLEAARLNPKGYALAVIEKENPLEKVGVVARASLEGLSLLKARIVEYTDIGEARALEKVDGALCYRWASTGVMTLSLETLKALALIDPAQKGWHLAHKKYEIAPEIKVDTIKRESFIFDLLSQEGVDEPSLVCYSREAFFSPIKSLEDIEKTNQAIEKRDTGRINRIQKNDLLKENKVTHKNLWSFYVWP